VSGVPGSGKSTFIEALGIRAIGAGHRVAVLSIDPSSSVSGGSILADKTRMVRLVASDEAYVRPTASAGMLGGVAASTRDAMLACEAAGYDVVIIETVGTGQSETAVATMTDLFILLQLPNTGDDLQAIKKGILELADLVVVNKADIDPAGAERAAAWISAALHAPVPCVSARGEAGLDELWARIQAMHEQAAASGVLMERRRRQQLQSMWEAVRAELEQQLRAHPAVIARLESVTEEVLAGRMAPRTAAEELMHAFAPGGASGRSAQ
jgi:LAO/AO transport system kinase